MSSIYELTLSEALQRLLASPSLVPNPSRVRRDHRTALPKDDAEAVYVIDGIDKPISGKRCEREATFRVAIIVRGDSPYERLDELKVEIVRRLSPSTASYESAVALDPPGPISVDSQIADADATRIDIEMRFCYAAPEWTLGE